MYKIYAYYDTYDPDTRQGDVSNDVFKADTKEAADQIVEGLDKEYYNYFEIVEIVEDVE